MISAPVRTLDVIAPEGSVLESSIYAGLCAVVGIVPTMLAYLVFFVAMWALGKGVGGEQLPKFTALAGGGIGAAVFAFYLVFFLAGSIVFLLLSSAVELLILRLAGVRSASYPAAVRAHALSMAAYVTGVVPMCSIYVFPIWSLVLRVFAIQKLQRTTAGIAVAAALLPIAVCCFAFIGFYAMVFAVAGLANR